MTPLLPGQKFNTAQKIKLARTTPEQASEQFILVESTHFYNYMHLLTDTKNTHIIALKHLKNSA